MVVIATTLLMALDILAAVHGQALLELYKLSDLGVASEPADGESACPANATGTRRATLVSKPGGSAVGRLRWDERSAYGSCVMTWQKEGEQAWTELHRGWDYPEVGYGSHALVYYDRQGEFARILARRAGIERLGS